MKIKNIVSIVIILLLLSPLTLLAQISSPRIKLEFTPEFSTLFQPGGEWDTLSEQTVKNNIYYQVFPKFDDWGISVSLYDGNVIARIGGTYTDKPDLFSRDITGFGSYYGVASNGGTAYCEIYTGNLIKELEFQREHIDFNIVVNGVAGVVMHELGHLLNLYHAYIYDSYYPDPSSTSTVDHYIPLEPKELPSSFKNDPNFKKHIMGEGDKHITMYDITQPRYFGDNSQQSLNFPSSLLKYIWRDFAWGVPSGVTYLNHDVYIETGKTFFIGASKQDGSNVIHLSGNSMRVTTPSAGGKIVILPTGDVIPNLVNLTYGPNLTGIYPNAQAAITNAKSGETIHIKGGTYNVNSVVTIPAGVTLQIEAGVTINFNQDITINGKLITNGTESDRVLLNFAPGKNLNLNGTEKYCNWTEFKGSGWNGINITDVPYSVFSNCLIEGVSHTGIYANNTQLSLDHTRILYSPMDGVNFVNGSQVNILQHNVFRSNTCDVRGDNTSIIHAGSSVTNQEGLNSFLGTDHLISTNPNRIFTAQYNYWKDNHPIVTSNVITDPTLPSDTNTGPYGASINAGNDHKAEIESGLFLKQTVVNDDGPIWGEEDEELFQAMTLSMERKFDEALEALRRLVVKYPYGVGRQAMIFIASVLKWAGRADEILPMLEEYSNSSIITIAEYAHYRIGFYWINIGEIDKGIEIIKRIEFSEVNADMRITRLYDLGEIYYNFGNKEEAYIYFNELLETYPESTEAYFVRLFYLPNLIRYDEPPIANETPTETKLFANYPNPFNPSTVIKYQLANRSHVSLKVYDVMGREVATLVNGFQNKGSYDVTFNANGLSSGIYLYRLNADGKQLINKMLLMK